MGDLSHRCISFFEGKPTSSSIPALRSELNYTMEKTDRLHNLSSVYLEKLVRFFLSCSSISSKIHAFIFTFSVFRLKTIDLLIHGLNEAESQVRKNESRLSEEDIVPADITAINCHRDQLGVTKPQTHTGNHSRKINAVRILHLFFLSFSFLEVAG